VSLIKQLTVEEEGITYVNMSQSYWLWSLHLTLALVCAGESRPSHVCEQ